MTPLGTAIAVIIPTLSFLVLGLWVFSRNPKSRVNRTFLAISISAFLWTFAHFFFWIFSDSSEALRFWGTIAYIPPAFFFSFILYFSYIFPENDKKVPWPKIALMFSFPAVATVLALGMTIISSYEPRPEGGFLIEWDWGSDVYNILMVIFFLWILFNFLHKLKHERGKSNRRSILIVFFGFLGGITMGAVFNIFLPTLFDETRFLSLGAILAGAPNILFVSYAIVRYDLMDIKVIAKQALFYGVVVGITTLLLSVVVLVSRFLEDDYPMLSLWLIPAVFSLLAVFLGLYIWRGMQASEALKYEFITVVTHKFRTPLTRVMWAVDDLKIQDMPQDQRLERAKSAENAAQNILELINLLTTVSGEKNALQNLNKETDISNILRKLLEEHRRTAAVKNIVTEENVEDGISVFADRSRVRFVMSVMLENAVMYTKQGGKINIALISDGDKVHFQVKDTGIGMDKKTQSLVFSTFFRGDKARLEDTEGMGVGLYIAKRIVDELDGKIGFHSEGDGEGSTFFFEMPIYKKESEEDQD